MQNNMLLMLKNEWRYMYFKMILTVPVLIIGVYLWGDGFGAMYGVVSGTSVISTVTYFNKEKKMQFNFMLPVSIVCSALLRIINLVFLPLIYFVIALLIFYIEPEIIEIGKIAFMISMYLVAVIIWFISEDISNRKGYGKKVRRLFKFLGFVLLIGLFILSGNYTNILIVSAALMIVLSMTSIYTFKRRSSYKA